MVRMVFADLDDTFLTPDKKITHENAQMLDVAYQRGVQFVPCTGRNIGDVPRELISHPAVRYAICCNGALVVDAQTRQPVHKVLMEKSAVSELFRKVRHLNVTFDIFADGRVYSQRERFGGLINCVDLSGPTRSFVVAGRTLVNEGEEQIISSVHDITRLNMFYLTDRDRDVAWNAIDSLSNLSRTQSLSCNIEVMSAEASKGSSLLWLCERLGVPVSQTVAFGDNENDRSMLAAAGDGVAMANATDGCKAAADHVTLSCSESGVARYLDPLLSV